MRLVVAPECKVIVGQGYVRFWLRRHIRPRVSALLRPVITMTLDRKRIPYVEIYCMPSLASLPKNELRTSHPRSALVRRGHTMRLLASCTTNPNRAVGLPGYLHGVVVTR